VGQTSYLENESSKFDPSHLLYYIGLVLQDFWNCCNSKVDRSSNACEQVDGTTDCDLIVDKFVKHFESAYTSINAARAAELKDEYTAMRNAYCGSPMSEDCMFDVDLVSKVICELKRGKAAGLDSLTAEH